MSESQNTTFCIDELKFNDQGLIPAIVQDHYSKKVLMMAWMLWGAVGGVCSGMFS